MNEVYEAIKEAVRADSCIHPCGDITDIRIIGEACAIDFEFNNDKAGIKSTFTIHKDTVFDIMASYYLQGYETKIYPTQWTTTAGDVMLISMMHTNHIINTVNKILNDHRYRGKLSDPDIYLEAFAKELRSRDD